MLVTNSESSGREGWVIMMCAVMAEVTRVLVVDDDPDFRALVCMALEVRGHQVEQAPSAADALAVISERGDDFTLVITDHKMPEMSGRELCAQLSRTHPGLATFLWSAFSDLGPDSLVKGMDSLDQIITKFERA